MNRPAQMSFTRLEEIVGGAYVVTDAAEIAAREVCGVRPAVVVRPADAAQIAEILRFAAAEKLAVIPTGGCTKLGIGSPPARYDIALDLSRMNRVLAYDPQDLTLGVEPGVRIEDLLRTLAEKKQFLPLAVPFSERATIGGIVAANSSSPLRHAYGGGPRFLPGHGICDRRRHAGEKRRARREKRDGLRSAQIADRIAGHARCHHAREFPHVSNAAVAGNVRRVFFLGGSAFDFCRAVSHSVLTPQMVEVADPGAAALIFSAETSARIEPRTWTVSFRRRANPPSWIAMRANSATWQAPRTPLSFCRSLMPKQFRFSRKFGNSRD